MNTVLEDMISVPPTRQEFLSRITREFTGDVLVEPAKCNGCLECIEACRTKMANRPGERSSVARIAVRSLDGAHVPLLCHNCADAPCAVACMTGCRVKTASGWVETDYARCVGCWMCVMACPFGVILPVYEDELAYKCDGCPEDPKPACTAACKPGALRRAGPYDLAQERRLAFAARRVLPVEEKGAKCAT